jgi:GWxTD domain-containing protein
MRLLRKAIACGLLSCLPGLAAAGIPVGVQALPPKYQAWLTEDVADIITAKEKDVFLKLGTDAEREFFIEAFWRQRDPVPETPVNEFREEYYRRIQYANTSFGKGTSRPGRKTDRGKIYVILGKPLNVVSYGSESSNLVPIEIWFYNQDFKAGLPSTFYVVFFQDEGMGDYILYSPLRHGPKKLLESYDGDPDRAVDILMRIDRELAYVSRSLIPGKTAVYDTRPALQSELLLNKIASYPQRTANDAYAEKLLKYKSLIEVDHSVNFVGNTNLVKILRERDGRLFVHYAVEPDKLSLGSVDGKYFVRLEVFGKISDSLDKTVFQFQKNVAMDLSREQVAEMKTKRFSFQDAFPLIEGRFRFDLLIKNPVSKEFTSFESSLILPDRKTIPELSPLVLSPRLSQEVESGSNFRPFRMGEFQTYPAAGRAFAQSDRLIISFKLTGADEALAKTFGLNFVFAKEDKVVRTYRKRLVDLGKSGSGYYEEVPLDAFEPGIYKAVVTLLDGNNGIVGSSQEDYEIRAHPSLPAYWSLCAIIPPLDDPFYSHVLGTELLNLDRLEEAKGLLEEAYRKKPESLEFALTLGRAYFRAGNLQGLQTLYSRFLDRAAEHPDIYELLGKSSVLQNEFGKAVYFFKKYLSRFGTNLEILNLLADCFLATGQIEEARAAWVKSLEMEPNQENVKKKLGAVR